jgi:hypothetical protein
MVRVTGLEPARPNGQKILSLMRLPFRHTRWWTLWDLNPGPTV